MKRVHYAAIDIGTNAGRLLIGYVLTQDGFSRVRQVQIVRVPLRLGDDVFNYGSISKEKEKQFIYTMKSFKMLMKAYGVKTYKAYATSAMREAKNRDEIINSIANKTDLHLEIIDGNQEANLIFKTFFTQKMPEEQLMFIDVGGGSTELSFIYNGEKKASKSFKLGTIRSLRDKNKKGVWEEIEHWLAKNKTIDDEFVAIGTGGNINRVAKMHQKKYLEPICIEEIKETLTHLESFSYEDRIQELRLKPDRADVIIPALKIYSRIMDIYNINKIYVPKMGLADGMILEQYFDDLDRDVFF